MVASDSVFLGRERGGIPLPLFGERRAIPSEEISRGCLAVRPSLSQTVMGCFAVAVNAVVSGADLDDEAVMLQLAKPQRDVVAVAMSAKFFLGVARRDKNYSAWKHLGHKALQNVAATVMCVKNG